VKFPAIYYAHDSHAFSSEPKILTELSIENPDFFQAKIYEMLIKTLYGISKMFIGKNINFENTVKRVAAKGGATEVGSGVLQSRPNNVYKEMIEKILKRQNS
jgi:hypothetical protein